MKPKVLIIDNYDSFTYNIADYAASLGADVAVVRNDKKSVEEIRAADYSHIVISPGPGKPVNSGIVMDLIATHDNRAPVLGICLGHQAIAEFFGGALKNAPKPVHGKQSVICHDGKNLFQGISNPLRGGRYHSLLIEKETLPECLEVSALTEDGLIMGLRHKNLPFEGVQFHPESILTESGMEIIENFLRMEVS